MATSPDYLRLASSKTRALADIALDHISHAVLVVDARHKHLPIVLANAAARRAFESPSRVALIEASLLDLLSVGSSQSAQYAIMDLTDGANPSPLPLVWNMRAGSQQMASELKTLIRAPGQRLVMLSLSEPQSSPTAIAIPTRSSAAR